MATRQDVLTEARKFIGTPFEHMGRSEAGIDCLGVGIVVGQRLGLLPATFGIPPYSPGGMPKYLEVFFSYVDEIAIDDALPGDGYLLCHDPARNRRPKHLMLRSEYGVIGAALWPTVHKVCEHRIDEFVQERIVTAWRYRGIDE